MNLISHVFPLDVRKDLMVLKLYSYLKRNAHRKTCIYFFLYFQHALEWEWIWYNLASSNRPGSLSGSGNTALIVLLTKDLYSVSSLILGASKIETKACTWGLHLSWNSIRNALYFVLPKGPSRTISLKKTCILYWKCLATRTGLSLRSLIRCWYVRFLISSSIKFKLINLLIM